jgi:hypothetical protein
MSGAARASLATSAIWDCAGFYNCVVSFSPEPTPRLDPGQTLLFDADDTLWENNIYFERAITSFISYLDHRVHTPEEVRGHLNQVERKATG